MEQTPTAQAQDFAAAPRPEVRAPAAGDDGMTTAEYAVGMIAACGFAAVLVKLLASSQVSAMLAGIVKQALSVAT